MDGNYSQSGSGFDHDNPQSDSDPYGSSDRPNPPNSLFAQFPTKVTIPPMSFGKRFTYITQPFYESQASALVHQKLQFIRVAVARWPTEEETDYAISVVDMRSNVIGGSQLAGASVVGLYLMRRNRALGPAGLDRATLARSGLAIPVALLLGRGLGGILGSSIDVVNTASDPRMARFRADLQRQNPDDVRRRLSQFRNRDTNNLNRIHGFPPDQQSPPQSPYQPRQPYQNVAANDASPTSGAFSSEYSSADYNREQQTGPIRGGAWGNIYQQRAQQQGSEYQTPPSDQSGYQQQAPPQQQQQQPQQTDGSGGVGFFDEDDRSNSATSPRSSPRAGGGGGGGGSAWARIRASTGASQSPPQTNSPSEQWQSTESDPSYSSTSPFSSPGPSEDTKRAKEQSQAEFDRLLQRERDVGKGTNDGSESGSAWGRRW